jgi:hypothetical protein
MKPRAWVNGAVVEGIYGRCGVCGEVLVRESELRSHEHRGHPKSVYDADGNPRVVLMTPDEIVPRVLQGSRQ